MKTCENCELIKEYQKLAKGKDEVILRLEKMVKLLNANQQLKIDFKMN